jgi:allantoin racemase
MSRIKVVVPVATSIWNKGALAAMEKVKETQTVINVTNVERGAESIEDSFDEAWSALPTLQAAMMAEKEGYDGVIIYCYGDPSVRAAKEMLTIPVVGIGEASAIVACSIGYRFGVITAGPPGAGQYLFDNLKIYELDHKCVGVRSVGIPVLSLVGAEEDEEERLVQIGKEMLQDGADVLVLGCGSMLGVAESASKRLGVPIVLPAAAALKLCEAMISMRLSQSKKAFPVPEEKTRIP